MLTEAALEFLASRGLDVETAVQLGFESFTDHDGGEGVKIPFHVDGDPVNHKWRRIDRKAYRQDSGGVQCFWNFDALTNPANDGMTLFIAEGEFDGLALIQSGYVRTVSVPAGAPSEAIGSEPSKKYDFLEHAKTALKGVREIILATDGDPPGQALLNDLSIRLGKARCKWLKYPLCRDKSRRLKDMNEVLQEYGQKGVDAVVDGAQWCAVDGVYRMSDLPPYGHKDCYSTGMRFLDEHYRVRMGDFCVVTGIPGHGKTTWLNDLTCRMASAHDWVIAIASFEQHPQADHRRFLREWYCNRAIERMLSPDEIEEADDWIDRHFVFIVPGDEDLANLAWTLDKVATAVIRHNVKVAVIDPWNELDHDRPSDMSLTEYTGKAIKEFKALAKNLNIHVIVSAHPVKLQSISGKIHKPGLYDISDSAHWANKPDVGIVIHKPDMTKNTATCTIVKSRYHEEIGKPGEVWMEYNAYSRRFKLGVAPGEID